MAELYLVLHPKQEILFSLPLVFFPMEQKHS